jgi:hypothetical protein
VRLEDRVNEEESDKIGQTGAKAEQSPGNGSSPTPTISNVNFSSVLPLI